MSVVETLVDLQSELLKQWWHNTVKLCFCFFYKKLNNIEEVEYLVCFHFPEHSCLWNHKSESYKNRQLRWKTLEHLRILLSAHPPPVRFTGKAVVDSLIFKVALCVGEKKCNLTLFCFSF